MCWREDSLASHPTIWDRFSIKRSCKTTRSQPNKDGLGWASLSLGPQVASLGPIAGSPSSNRCWSGHPEPFSGSLPFHRWAWMNFHKMPLLRSFRKSQWQTSKSLPRIRDPHDYSWVRQTFQGRSCRDQGFSHPFSKSPDIELSREICWSCLGTQTWPGGVSLRKSCHSWKGLMAGTPRGFQICWTAWQNLSRLLSQSHPHRSCVRCGAHFGIVWSAGAYQCCRSVNSDYCRPGTRFLR